MADQRTVDAHDRQPAQQDLVPRLRSRPRKVVHHEIRSEKIASAVTVLLRSLRYVKAGGAQHRRFQRKAGMQDSRSSHCAR